MISLKPRSILQLTLTGFLLVTGILIVALITTARQLNGLSERSQQIISETASAMQSSRTLIEQASAMERNALQYDIIRDPEILKVYTDRRVTFGNAAQQLSSLTLGDDMVALINRLVTNEALAYRSLVRKQAQEVGGDDTLYPRLLEITYDISDLVNRWSGQQQVAIRQEATETQNLLMAQGILLVSIALVLAGTFTALITRPLLQIGKSINLLGRGNYEHEIRVSGPRDLIDLGNLLDWLRNRLRKLEQHRLSFFRHVSHELKTPLAAMQESSALLQDGVVGELNAEQLSILRIQSSNCRRLQSLIDDLLSYNTGSFSVLNAMPVPVRLDRLTEKVVAGHELMLHSCDIRVDSRLEKITVKGDEEQFRVIIDNLLTNAIKYSPRSGTVSIRLGSDHGETVFDIMDQGPGISTDEKDKIFELFYQGAPSDKHYLKGSGLGLTIAREYATSNGAELTLCESKQGAHFRLTIPTTGKEPT
jgi:two-component system sensor histidine kinase GlrK